MERPEGLAGDPVFIVKDVHIGNARRGGHLLPATVNIRVERVKEQHTTIEHDKISDWLDFGITSNVWNYLNVRVLFPAPGLIKFNQLVSPFTDERVAVLAELAEFHHNSLYDYCAHQKPPQGPRGRRPGPCPLTGFEFGDDWLVRPLPEDFVTRLREVFEGCDSDRIYDSGED